MKPEPGYLLRALPSVLVRGDMVASVLPAVGVVFLLGLVACSGPLLRAMHIPPSEAMRGEG